MNGWPEVAPSAQGDVSYNHNGAPAEEPTESPEQFILRRDSMIGAWLSTKQHQVEAIAVERAARNAITSLLFPTPKKGTQRYALNHGWNMKLAQTYTYKLGDKTKQAEDGTPIPIKLQVEELEERIVALGPIAALLCDRLITWNPEVSGSEYEKLDKADPVQLEVRTLIDELLTITPGAPQLELEEPKG